MSAVSAATGVEATLFGRRVRLYDLSHLSQDVSQQTQMHPLHPRVEVYPYESHANSALALGTGFSYRSCLLIMSDHASTHVDAMCHFLFVLVWGWGVGRGHHNPPLIYVPLLPGPLGAH
jgi:hypothetical protein